jgi:hypothetical protein
MGEKYKIGKLRASNVAIGDHATAEYTRHADPERAEIQAQALYQVRQLIELMAIHAEEINGPDAAMADAESIENVLQEKNPNRSRIMNLIGNIGPAVAGVTALAKAIDAIHATVSHL